MPTNLRILTAADLHRSGRLYEQLGQAAALHRPDVVALVGDFLHGFADNEGRLPTGECARLLSQLPCAEVLFVRGNHEDAAWWPFAMEWKKSGRPLRALHGEAFLRGPLVVVGFPCLMGEEEAFIGLRAPLPLDPDEWLPAVIRPWGAAARTLWLMHEPPFGTLLSQAGSLVEGNPEWAQAVGRFSPWLAVCGHDHVTPLRRRCWHSRLGETVCVNVGQTDHGPLHYCVVEAEFPKRTPCLPTRMTVTAFPLKESVALPLAVV